MATSYGNIFFLGVARLAGQVISYPLLCTAVTTQISLCTDKYKNVNIYVNIHYRVYLWLVTLIIQRQIVML
jgi:hypothetical protein